MVQEDVDGLASVQSDPEAWKTKMYIENLPEDIKPFRELLEKYSNIPADEVDKHILNIRDKAWNIAMYPCIGHFVWVQLLDFKLPAMDKVMARLLAPGSQETFLELGCFVGQTTRNLVYKGLDPSRVYASDLRSEFWDLGFELFRDREKMREATFVSGNMLEPDDEFDAGLGKTLTGKASIILASSFFHLFNREQQVRIGKRVVSFFRPGTGKPAVLFGAQMGSVEPEEKFRIHMTTFWHNQDSFQDLWDEIGEGTATRWKVEVSWMDHMPIELLEMGEDARMSRFVVTQVLE